MKKLMMAVAGTVMALWTGTVAAETIALGVGSDQCLSEPTDLVQNRLVGAVQTWKVGLTDF